MTAFLRALLRVTALAAVAAPAAALAQSTDGFHAGQVIPVVVDSSSYTSRITFTNTLVDDLELRAFFIPAEGTTQPSELDCGTFLVAGGQVRTFGSLRELCPGLPAGSQFGSLHTRVDDPSTKTGLFSYAAYARVQNPQGIGFSVEGFPPHTFTGAWASVSGLRRLAATPVSPAYQSNCFVGSLHLEAPNTTFPGTSVYYRLYRSDGKELAYSQLTVPSGKLVRMLDVFAAAQVPPGDLDDVRAEFYVGGTASVLAFCTVQDNTSYSADFRIAKQAYGFTSVQPDAVGSPFAQDDHVLRRSLTVSNIPLTNGAGGMDSQYFGIFSNSSNAHLLQLRHPDWIACEVIHFDTRLPNTQLEMRLLAGSQVIAGGNNIQGFGPVYLGDKYGINPYPPQFTLDKSANGSYVLEVERIEGGTNQPEIYSLVCRSGSGHSVPYLLRTGGPNQF